MVNNTSIEPQEVKRQWLYLSTLDQHGSNSIPCFDTIPTNPKDLLPSGMNPDTYIQQN